MLGEIDTWQTRTLEYIASSSSIEDTARYIIENRVPFVLPLAKSAARLVEPNDDDSARYRVACWISNLFGQSLSIAARMGPMQHGTEPDPIPSSATPLDGAEMMLSAGGEHHEVFTQLIQRSAVKPEVKMGLLALFVERRLVEALPCSVHQSSDEDERASLAKCLQSDIKKLDLEKLLRTVVELEVSEDALVREKQRFEHSRLLAVNCILSLGGCVQAVLPVCAKSHPILFDFFIDFLISERIKHIGKKKGLSMSTIGRHVQDCGSGNENARKRIQELHEKLEGMNAAMNDAVLLLRGKLDPLLE